MWIGETEIAACPDKDFRKGCSPWLTRLSKSLAANPIPDTEGKQKRTASGRGANGHEQPERASSDLERALLAIQKKGGAKPDDGPLAELGLSLLRMQKFAEAEPAARVPGHPRKANARTTGDRECEGPARQAPLGQKKYAEAEPLLREGYEGMKRREGQIPLVGKARLTEAAERLVQLYEATNRPEKAGHWRQELERGSKE